MQEYIPYIQTDLNVVKKDNMVGIIIPYYNHGKYIENAIDSVLEQDYPNKLIIIVDDKSTDDSLEVAKSLFYKIRQEVENKAGDKIFIGHINTTDVILISLTKNGKQANARNMGIATTWNYCDYYMQLDADDEYLPGKISKSMEVMMSDPDNIGLVYSDVIIKNNLNNITTHEFREPYYYDRLCQEDIVSNQPLINKKALEKVGLYDKDISPTEDWDLFLRIAQYFICIHIPELLQIYNVVDSSCTFTVDKNRWQWCWNRIHEKLQQRHQ